MDHSMYPAKREKCREIKAHVKIPGRRRLYVQTDNQRNQQTARFHAEPKKMRGILPLRAMKDQAVALCMIFVFQELKTQPCMY